MATDRHHRGESEPTLPKRLDLTLESTLEAINLAEAMILKFSECAGYGERAREEIGLAVRESVANAILHGNRGDASKQVEIRAEFQGPDLVISIRDEGEGFDPESLPDPRQPEYLMRKSGRGILLMKELMDDFILRRPSTKGTQVTLVKRAPGIPQEEKKVSIKASSRQVGGVTILDLSGRITLGEGSNFLRESLRGLSSQGQKKILLNLSEVSYIDSAGIGELVTGYTSIKSQGGQLKLASLSKKVNDLLQITRLISVFEVYPSEAEAIRDFQ